MANKVSLLFLGDIVGEGALGYVEEKLPELIEKYSATMVVANGENIDGGKGLNATQAERLYKAGVQIITTGNHVWDNWDSKPLLYKDNRVLRPLNYPQGNPGMSYKIFELADGVTKVAVLQLQGRIFMPPIDCPFKAAESVLKRISQKTNIILVDFHAETTAEKITMGWYLDGKVSALLGTHTHIQTADAQLLPQGTAYITDVGMCGPYDSVIGMEKDVSIKRMTLGTAHKYQLAEKDLRISAIHVEIDADSGQAMKIEPISYPGFARSFSDMMEF